jgi:hypothetical protein
VPASKDGVAVSVDSVRDLRRLQSAAGNRAMGRVLARLSAYDTKLANSDSVVQPPVMWVKYPPDIPTMARVELFDAIDLISEWLARDHKQYVGELTGLRDRLRKHAHRVTTDVEFRTFSRYAHKPRHLLREAYQAVVQKVIADRRVLSVLSLDALDEVVQDRFPGAQWPAAARSWIDRYVHEEDRRSQRYTKLVWYERIDFEKFEARARQLDAPGYDLWRELSWQWIDLRDAHQDRKAIEEHVIDGLGALYEQLLHEIDKLIQTECAKHHPETWGERVQENLYKAWGDPCKPWFGPDGTHGPDELRFFKTKLGLIGDDDAFASVYYWVQEYLQAKRLLTDPKAQLAAMQSQAVAALFVHWATIMEYSPQISAQAQALGEFVSRKGADFLQHTMIGYRLVFGDLGGSGAEVGNLGNRPTITAVSSSAPGAARPLAPPRPEMPDLPAQSAPAQPEPSTAAPVGVEPAAQAPDTPRTPELTRPSPASALPPSTASKWTPPPAPATKLPPPPPPAFTKAKDLKFPNAQNQPTAETVKQAILTSLTTKRLKSGTNDQALPSGWKAMYQQLKQALLQNADEASRQLLEVLDIVWGALRNPALYAEVLASAWERAIASNSSIDQALVTMAEASTGQKAAWIPRYLGDWLLKNPGAFFDLYASQPMPFVDLPLIEDVHGALTHLLQDLVVDLGLKLANKNLTSAQVRNLLVHIPGKIKPLRVPAGPIIDTGGPDELRIGDYAWQLTYDLNVPGRGQLPQPEALGEALRPLLKLK